MEALEKKNKKQQIKKAISRALLIVILLVGVCLSVATASRTEGPYKVADIYEGNNLVLETDDDKRIHVKLIGVDTPYYESEAGQKALAYTEKLIGESNVLIEYDKNKQDWRYRHLAYVYNAKDEMLNEELLLAGMGEFEETSNDRYEDELKKAESKAKADKLGIWAKGSIKER